MYHFLSLVAIAHGHGATILREYYIILLWSVLCYREKHLQQGAPSETYHQLYQDIVKDVQVRRGSGLTTEIWAVCS